MFHSFLRPWKAIQPNRYWFLFGAFGAFFLLIVIRLFQLQVVQHAYYRAQAREQHFGSLKLPAKRGEILVRDRSGTYYKLATNITLDLLYVDPLWVDAPDEIVVKLPPLLYDALCQSKSDQECQDALDDFRDDDVAISPSPIAADGLAPTPTPTPRPTPKPKLTRADAEVLLGRYVRQVVEQKEVTRVALKRFAVEKKEDEDLLQRAQILLLPGVHVTRTVLSVNPVQVGDLNATAKQLSDLLGMPAQDVRSKIARRQARYVPILNRVPLDISQRIKDLKLKGLVLIPEHWRHYPEKSLAAQTVGFVNADGEGEYGFERAMDERLRGVTGYVNSENDLMGRQLTIGENDIQPATDGNAYVLTIDRNIQAGVEERLAKAVEDYQANSGEVIVMDPYTGSVLAMAQYPTFDPNQYRDAYITKEVRTDPGKAMTVIKQLGESLYLTYANKFGPGVFLNQMVSSLYEPGSIFKPVTIAVGLDTAEIKPGTTYVDRGEIEVDEYTIHNVSEACLGTNTIEHALNYSCNIGMAFVSKRLGRNLFYTYLANFGFGERTDIEGLDHESKGVLKHVRNWAASNLATIAFGQGISVTPLQMAVSYSALANGGLILRPTLIAETHTPDGKVEKSNVEVIQRVISKETSDTITAMLVSSVEKGVARRARLPDYYIAGKTGTSQISLEGREGFEDCGAGCTIASFAGYAPAQKPKFVMVVKLTRPRTSQWGDSTAAPLFSDIARFVLEYMTIPPER